MGTWEKMELGGETNVREERDSPKVSEESRTIEWGREGKGESKVKLTFEDPAAPASRGRLERRLWQLE